MTKVIAKPKVMDYTKMELGRVTRTWKGRPSASIARCRKCNKLGERSSHIPEPDQLLRGGKPYVSVTHVLEIRSWGADVARAIPMFGRDYGYVRDSCSIPVDATNVDDLLNVPERKDYDAWVAALQAYVAQF